MAKSIRKLNIKYKEINIKQQAQVTYLGCVSDESMSGECLVNSQVCQCKLSFLS